MITSTLAYLLMSSVAALPSAQPQPPLMQGNGSISGGPTENKIYDENGRVVKATEWVTLTYNVTWALEDSEITETKVRLTCQTVCQGKKHTKHEECDTSCDKPCAIKKRLALRGKYEPLTQNMRQAERDSATAARASGATVDTNWTSASSRALREARRMAERKVDKAIPHWETRPCSESDRTYGLRRWDFRVRGSFTRNIVRMESGVRTTRSEPGASHEMVVAHVWLPEEEPILINNLDDLCAVGAFCACIKDVPPVKPPPVQPPKEKINRIPTFSGLGWRNPDGTIDRGKVPPEYQLLLNGQDLNNIEAILKGPQDKPMECEIPFGMICVPDKPTVQIMITVVTVTVTMQVGEDLLVSRDPFAWLAGPTKIRAACLEMDKKEPDESVKFRLERCTDNALANLAAITNSSRFRGPQDQARIWIYTDKAPIEKINERLLPGVTEGQYLNALYDVANVGGVDVTKGDYRRCVQADLLIGTTARAGATQWLVDVLSETDPKALVRFAKTNASKVRTLLSSSEAGRLDEQHFATLADALCSSLNDEVRLAGLEFLTTAIPEAKREKAIAAGALNAVTEALFSEEPKVASKALEVTTAYGYKQAIESIRALAEWGKAEAVKKLALETITKLGAS